MSAVSILEGNASGHRLFYVRRLLEGIADSWSPIFITGNDTESSPEYQIQLNGAPRRFSTQRVAQWPSSFAGRRTLLKSLLSSMYDDHDLLVIPDGDAWLLPLVSLAFHGRAKSACLLLMRTQPNSSSRVPAYVAKATIARLGSLRGIRLSRLIPSSGEIESNAFPLLRFLPTVRDPVPTTRVTENAIARRDLGISPAVRLLLVPGFLDERKSPAHIIKWIEESRIENIAVAFVGPRAESMNNLFVNRTHDTRFIQRNLYISDKELSLFYSACDAVVALYENQGPSGALAFALSHAKPIVCWGNADLMKSVALLGNGAIAADRSPTSLDSAFEKCLAAMPPRSNPPRFQEDASEFFRTLTRDSSYAAGAN